MTIGGDRGDERERLEHPSPAERRQRGHHAARSDPDPAHHVVGAVRDAELLGAGEVGTGQQQAGCHDVDGRIGEQRAAARRNCPSAVDDDPPRVHGEETGERDRRRARRPTTARPRRTRAGRAAAGRRIPPARAGRYRCPSAAGARTARRRHPGRFVRAGGRGSRDARCPALRGSSEDGDAPWACEAARGRDRRARGSRRAPPRAGTGARRAQASRGDPTRPDRGRVPAWRCSSQRHRARRSGSAAAGSTSVLQLRAPNR